jgi:DNA-directed RNA polymerase specialized sigma24 family protein
MPIPILAALDHDRCALVADRRARERFEQWKSEEQVLSEVDDLAGLLALANNRRDLDAGDAVLAVLARRAATERLAGQLLLHALMPGLKGIIRSCNPGRGADDLASDVITTAWERIHCYPYARRPQRIAANILRDVRQQIWRKQARQQRLAERLGEVVAFDDDRDGSPQPSPSDELVDLVADAVRRGRISRRSGRLILLHRVVGVSTDEIARSEGRTFCAIERARQRAEADLAAAVA